MKRLRFWSLLWLTVFILGMGCNILAAEDGLDILAKSDAIFSPEQVKFKFRMEDYEKDKFKRYYVFESYIKGSDRYLLLGAEPAVFKGIVQLRLGDTIFNYLKKIDKVNQVSAKVAFCSTLLSQEDVMSTKLTNFYQVENFSKSQSAEKDIYTFNLTAKSKEVAYNKISCHLSAQDYLLIGREYFAFSGQKIKEMKVEDMQVNNGRLTLLKFTMYDSLRKGYYTKVVMSDFNYTMSIPDTYFTKTYMKVAAK